MTKKIEEMIIRKKGLKKRLVLFTVFGIAIISGLFWVNTIAGFIGLFIGISFFFAEDLWISKCLKKEYKILLIKEVLTKRFANIKYDEKNGFNRKQIESVEAINMGDYFFSDDFVSGECSEFKFAMADVRIIKNQVHKEKSTRNIMYGQWYEFEFNKKFKNNLVVFTKGFAKDIVAKNKKAIELEDNGFNELFDVLGTNLHEAFYILTPHFMDKLKSLYEKYNKDILFCFNDNKLYIGINTLRESFEICDDFSVDGIDEAIKSIEEEIKVIGDLVDILDLDSDLFK